MHDAFAAYEDARHRLPASTKRGACAALPDLDALNEDIDAFLLDVFGVLSIDETAIAGVPERVAGLQIGGVRALIAGFRFFADHDVSHPIETSGLAPDYIFARP